MNPFIQLRANTFLIFFGCTLFVSLLAPQIALGQHNACNREQVQAMYQAARNLPSQSAASYQRFLDEADRTYPCLIDSQDPYLGQLDYQYARAFLALNDYNSVYRHIDLALSRDPETPHPFEY